jgi:hypothetical protein
VSANGTTIEQTSTLAAALVAALSDLSVVEKNRTAKIDTKGGGNYSYDYADIGDIVKATRPVLAQHGIVALTPVHEHHDGLACTVVLLHTSGERLDLGPFPFPHGRDAQATGSMVTYHRRYALISALGIATGEDDDGAAAVARQPTSTAREPESPYISEQNATTLVARCMERGLVVSEVIRLGTGGRTSDPTEVLKEEVGAIKIAMDNLTPADGQEPAVGDLSAEPSV